MEKVEDLLASCSPPFKDGRSGTGEGCSVSAVWADLGAAGKGKPSSPLLISNACSTVDAVVPETGFSVVFAVLQLYRDNNAGQTGQVFLMVSFIVLGIYVLTTVIYATIYFIRPDLRGKRLLERYLITVTGASLAVYLGSWFGPLIHNLH